MTPSQLWFDRGHSQESTPDPTLNQTLSLSFINKTRCHQSGDKLLYTLFLYKLSSGVWVHHLGLNAPRVWVSILMGSIVWDIFPYILFFVFFIFVFFARTLLFFSGEGFAVSFPFLYTFPPKHSLVRLLYILFILDFFIGNVNGL